MAMSTFSVRMDEQLKSDLDKLCEQFGMNTSVAINIFARAPEKSKNSATNYLNFCLLRLNYMLWSYTSLFVTRN